MSYKPLHHKYRPSSFAELVGQEAIATTLTNAIRTTKIAPAYLFTGPRGTGKTSSARILAKSLNCLKSAGPTPRPCGVCDVCQGITKGYSLDVIEIDAASNTGVENVRDIIEKAQFAPVQCRYKVYVVDECHMLSNAAFNSLLKTLEEPPKHVVFVLATTDPQRVLPTIISRCQRFDFRRIPTDAMVKHLSAIASQENINITHEAITLVAQIAQGGLRDAESLLDQLSLSSGEVTPERVWDLVGEVSEQDLLTLLSAIASDNVEAVVDCTRKILDRGREPLIILQNLAAFYRDLLIAKTAPSRNDLVACTNQTWKALVDFATLLDISTILAGQQHLQTAEVQLKSTTQPRLWLEVTLLGLLPSANSSTPALLPTPRPTSPPNPITPTPIASSTTEDTSTREHVEERHLDAGIGKQEEISTSNDASPRPPASEAAGEPSVDHSVEQIWQQVLASLSVPAKALMKEHGRLLTIDDGVAVVSVPPGLVKLAQGKLADIEAAFKQCQYKVKVSLVPNQSQTAPANEQKASPLPQRSPASNPDPAPSPEILKPAKTPTANTTVQTNVANGHVATPPPQPQVPPVDWETDEVAMIAAQRLAQFFDGEIVGFTDNAELPKSKTASEWGDESEADSDEF